MHEIICKEKNLTCGFGDFRQSFNEKELICGWDKAKPLTMGPKSEEREREIFNLCALGQ